MNRLHVRCFFRDQSCTATEITIVLLTGKLLPFEILAHYNDLLVFFLHHLKIQSGKEYMVCETYRFVVLLSKLDKLNCVHVIELLILYFSEILHDLNIFSSLVGFWIRKNLV